MPEQLIFDLNKAPAYKREDYLSAPANEAALNFILNWPNWPSNSAVIFGPAASGKTHILHVWKAHSGATIINASDLSESYLKELQNNFPQTLAIDNVDQWLFDNPEHQKLLFHLLNDVAANDAALLMTALKPPMQWSVELADLRSRIKALPAIELQSPDETLLLGLFVKLLYDRQLNVDPDVVPFTISRLERSCAAIIKAVEKIDAASLKEKRRITLPFVKKTLNI